MVNEGNKRRRSGLFEAKAHLEKRIGTSLELVAAGDPEAIRIMEESLEAERQWILKTGSFYKGSRQHFNENIR